MTITWVSIFILVLLVIAASFFGISQFISVVFGAPYFKTPEKVVKAAIKMAAIKPGEIFYDLGCGSGRIVKYVADNFNAKAYGIEISPLQFLKAKLLTVDNSNVEIKHVNIKNVNLSQANIIFCYLRQPIMDQLEQKFKRELKAGARLIIHGFPLKNKPAAKIKKIDHNTLYLYTY